MSSWTMPAWSQDLNKLTNHGQNLQDRKTFDVPEDRNESVKFEVKH